MFSGSASFVYKDFLDQRIVQPNGQFQDVGRRDFTQSLGLKLELTRGTRFGFDRLRTDIDPDAVNLGIRWSF